MHVAECSLWTRWLYQCKSIKYSTPVESMWGRGDQMWSWRHTGLDPLKFKSFLIQLWLLQTYFVELWSLFITHCFPIFFVSHLTSPLLKVSVLNTLYLCSRFSLNAIQHSMAQYKEAWKKTASLWVCIHRTHSVACQRQLLVFLCSFFS